MSTARSLHGPEFPGARGHPGARRHRGPRLQLDAGPSYVVEKFEDGDKNDYLAARIAWNLEAVLVPNVSFFHRAQLFPSLTPVGDFLTRTQTGLRATLVGGLFGEGNVLWDYNSDPSEDRDRQDVIYQLGVGWALLTPALRRYLV